MLRITVLRLTCYVLAIASLVGFWWYVSPGIVNDIFEMLDAAVKAGARVIASFTNTSPLLAESIVTDRMNLERTIFLSVLMILWMSLLLAFSKSAEWHVRRAIVTIVVVHLILLVAWFGWTEATAAWYEAHKTFVRGTLRFFGWYYAETVILRVAEMHSVLVFGEVLALYTIISSRFERRSLERVHIGRRLDQHADARR